MKFILGTLLLVSLSIFNYSQDLLAPIDEVTAENNSQSYVPSVNLTGNFNELVVVVGFPDQNRRHAYSTLETDEYYPKVSVFPDGTLLKDYIAAHGHSIPADQWFQPAFNDYFTNLSGGLYNVNFQFVKSSSNGGTYLSDHDFSYWATQNGESNNT